jgi:hypothetical protein
MELVGAILYAESARLGVAHPYFAPTILDGGVSKYTTGEVAEQVIAGVPKSSRDGAGSGGRKCSGRTARQGPHLSRRSRECGWYQRVVVIVPSARYPCHLADLAPRIAVATFKFATTHFKPKCI